MKTYIKIIFKTTFVLTALLTTATSCEKDNEEEELDIEFKTETGFTYTDKTIADGTSIKIGIEAETEKRKDPIIKFTITESINGGADDTIYEEELEDKEYEHDYSFTFSDNVSGNTHLYTFTVTNRDGITKHEMLTLTVQ